MKPFLSSLRLCNLTRYPYAFALLLLSLLWVSCQQDQAPNFPQWSGKDEALVQAEFDAVCQQLTESEHPYYGHHQISRLESALPKLPETALPQSVTRAQLAMEYLRLGKNAKALESLHTALSFAETDAVPEPVYLDILRRYALAQLRIAESLHCIDDHHASRCIWPLSQAAIHQNPEPAQQAARAYSQLQAMGSATPTTTWLKLVAEATAGTSNTPTPPTSFNALKPGLRLTDSASIRGLLVNEPSGGVAVADFDQDQDLDIAISTIDPCGGIRLFVNEGDGKFIEMTEQTGLASQGGALNLIHGDIEGDGDIDIFALRGGWFGTQGQIRNSLLVNQGNGTFIDVTDEANLSHPAYPTQTAAFADFNGDGRLDLFIGNEAGGNEASDDDQPYPSQLFIQQTDGRFTDQATIAGVTNDRFAKGVSAADFDADGDVDIYISNLGPNRYYVNNFVNSGDLTFTDRAPELGMISPAERSFGVIALDFNQDGHLDLFVANYGATLDDVAADLLGKPQGTARPYLYQNLGDGRFKEVGQQKGFNASSLPMGLAAGDLDHNGFPDLYLGTGTPSYESIAPNKFYLNIGGMFYDVTDSTGLGHLQKGHGIAFADFDRNGSLEILEQMGGAYPGDAYPSVLYQLENPPTGTWTEITLDPGVGQSALGAKAIVTISDKDGAQRNYYGWLLPAGSFSGSPLTIRLGLGSAVQIDEIAIIWPNEKKPLNYGKAPINGSILISKSSDQVQVP